MRRDPNGARRKILRCATGICLVFLLGFTSPASTQDGGKPQPKEQVRLRVLTQNLWGLPLGLSDGLKERMERFEKLLPPLKADVVLLQEVWTKPIARRFPEQFGKQYRISWSKRTKEELPDKEKVSREIDRYLGEKAEKKKAFLLALYPKLMVGAPRGGLVTLTAGAAADVGFAAFPEAADLSFAESLGGKGMLQATIETELGPVVVVNTHLARTGRELRKAQLKALHERLEKLRGSTVILGGDLNLTPVERGKIQAEYKKLIDSGFVDTMPPVKGPEGWSSPGLTIWGRWPRPDAESPGLAPKFDYILVRPAKGVRVVVERAEVVLWKKGEAVSDHNGILAEVRLEK